MREGIHRCALPDLVSSSGRGRRGKGGRQGGAVAHCDPGAAARGCCSACAWRDDAFARVEVAALAAARGSAHRPARGRRRYPSTEQFVRFLDGGGLAASRGAVRALLGWRGARRRPLGGAMRPCTTCIRSRDRSRRVAASDGPLRASGAGARCTGAQSIALLCRSARCGGRPREAARAGRLAQPVWPALGAWPRRRPTVARMALARVALAAVGLGGPWRRPRPPDMAFAYCARTLRCGLTIGGERSSSDALVRRLRPLCSSGTSVSPQAAGPAVRFRAARACTALR